MSKIEQVFKERGHQHGDYKEQARAAEQIKEILRESLENSKMAVSYDKRHSLDLIATKLSRIVAGDPNHEDHWRDIEGYARLIADDLAGRPRPMAVPSAPVAVAPETGERAK